MDKKADVVELVVVIGEDTYECLYIEGKRWDGAGEMTVYACDLVDAASGRLIKLEHRVIDDRPGEWPERLEDLEI